MVFEMTFPASDPIAPKVGAGSRTRRMGCLRSPIPTRPTRSRMQGARCKDQIKAMKSIETKLEGTQSSK